MNAAVERARAEVCRLHAALVDNGLVAWTSGNVSARVPGAVKGDGEGGGPARRARPRG
jgi:ribulose-5-phosphate 4-epimerase/fuculose-1-phosphate aldolase